MKYKIKTMCAIQKMKNNRTKCYVFKTTEPNVAHINRVHYQRILFDLIRKRNKIKRRRMVAHQVKILCIEFSILIG